MSNRRAQVCLLLLSTIVFSSLSYAAQADRIKGSVFGGRRVALAGNVHRLAIPQFDQGAVDPRMPMGTILLQTVPTTAQQKALTQLLAEQQDRSSPNYHKWLTPEQWADRFGLSTNDVVQITGWLKAQGFTMIHAARGRNWVSFTGTAAQVQNALGTEIHRFNVKGEMHYANATAPTIPAALSGIVTGFRGLHDFRPRPMNHKRVRPAYYDAHYGADFAAPGDIATIYDINGLYTAGIDGTGQKLAVMGQTDLYLADLNDFRTAFGLSSISCTTNTSDVITACNDPHFKYVLDGVDPGLSVNGDISEADLDLEWSGAVARGAQIIYVNSTDTFASFYYAIDNNVAPVISLSYGECEFDDNYINTAYPGQTQSNEAELQKANSEGITFLDSSGDSGVAECDYFATVTSANLATQGLAVSYPASSPEVTGVGGSAIPLANLSSTYWGTTNGADGGTALSYIPEQVWNDDLEFQQYCTQNTGSLFCSQGGSTPQPGWIAITDEKTAQEDIGISSSGGGGSNCNQQNAGNSACLSSSGFAKPAWQTVTVSGQPNVRLTPDVSFLASPNFPGYIFCTPLSELSGITSTTSSCASGVQAAIDQHNSVIGGTSASAPLFAGMVALLNQYLASSSPGGLGNINQSLYALAQSGSNGAFNPITSGDNNVYCSVGTPSTQPTALQCPASGVFGYQASSGDATTGFNLVAGLGSVNANHLAIAMAGSFTLSPSPASLTAVAGQSTGSTTITITPQNGFSGTVSFSCSSGLPTGATCTFTAVDATSSTLVISTTANMAAASNVAVTVKGTSGAASATTTVNLSVTATTESFTLGSSISGGTLSVAQGSNTSAVNMTVSSSSTPSFILNSGTSSQTVLPITYTCTGLPSASTCTFTPGSPTSATSVSLTITTTAPSARLHPPLDRGAKILYAALLPGLFGIMLTFGSRKRCAVALRVVGLVAVLGCSTLWLASCGSSGSGSVGNPGTPLGTYPIKVNATTGGAAPITSSMSFQLTVTQ